MKPEPRWLKGTALALGVLSGCATAGSAWMAEPLPGDDREEGLIQDPMPHGGPLGRAARPKVRVLRSGMDATSNNAALGDRIAPGRAAGGRSLGTFRNTYYDFPSEAEFDGPKVALKNARCETIQEVPRSFFESLCVQGSGTLKRGSTVSFAKRNCGCAEVCPRTGQRICFDALDARQFPWGRGATGKPITPLLSVAVDTDVIPLGTAIYVPEFDGLPRDLEGASTHDGCFIAQDRGLKVQGKHLDIFTGHSAMTALWNRLLPSNQGVTVVLESPRCSRSE